MPLAAAIFRFVYNDQGESPVLPLSWGGDRWSPLRTLPPLVSDRRVGRWL